MAGIGTKAQACPGTYLRDAQGKEIATSDIRDVSFAFETLDGDQVTIKERAFFSDRVDSPLISFGKLLKTGWSIESSDMSGPPLLSHRNGAKVELAFRNSIDTCYVRSTKLQTRSCGSSSLMREWRKFKVRSTWKPLQSIFASTWNKKVKMREMSLITEDAERLQKLCKELTRSP